MQILPDFLLTKGSDTYLNVGVVNTRNPEMEYTFQAVFKPKAGGTRVAAMHIQNNDPDRNPFDLTLTGMGVK